jgi:hypothetical protein
LLEIIPRLIVESTQQATRLPKIEPRHRKEAEVVGCLTRNVEASIMYHIHTFKVFPHFKVTLYIRVFYRLTISCELLKKKVNKKKQVKVFRALIKTVSITRVFEQYCRMQNAMLLQ